MREVGTAEPLGPGQSEQGLLTPQQHRVLELLDEGLRVAEIARRLGISETTVRNHVRAILSRLGCHSQLEAVAAARRRGIILGERGSSSP